MKKLNSIIVDDDAISQKILTHCMSRIGVFDKMDICSKLSEFKNNVDYNLYDVIFLDVEFPGESGIDFLKTVNNLPPVVLVSSKKNYAYDAFNCDVIDFLHKPIDYNRFCKTVDKIKPLKLDQNQIDNLFFKVNGKLVKINLKDILYCESMSDYIKIYTAKGMVVVLQTMSKLEQLLPNNFVRCHRSFIVNLDKVEVMDDRILEINKNSVPVSRSYYSEIKKRLNIIG